MIRIVKWSILAGLAAVALPGAAWADDDIKSLVADCGGANVKADEIDSCLERARVLGEDSPSPQLQALTASLERIAERGDSDNDLSKVYDVTPVPEQTAGGGTAPVAAPRGKLH